MSELHELHERDAMTCRSCGNEERASEGYPCTDCGTFLCMMCVMKGVERCVACTALAWAAVQERKSEQPITPTDQVPPRTPGMDWPEH